MELNRVTDKLMFMLLSRGLDDRLQEVIDASRKGTRKERLNLSHISEEAKPTVKKFVSIFKENFSTKQTAEMISRVNSLKIVEEIGETVKVQKFISLGSYDNATNQILLNKYEDREIPFEKWETLMHELLHMASTKETDHGTITGLEISGYIGLQLNEGYTEYLAEKYFTKGMKYTNTDDYKVFFAKGIENVVGSKRMEKYYFDANIGELVKDLEKYAKRKDIFKLLFLIDKIEDPFFTSREIRSIVLEIAKINEAKLEKDYQDGKLSDEQFDIEYAIKVIEYKKNNLWSEETVVKKDGNSFLLVDQGKSSDLYEFTPTEETYQK